MSSGPKIGLENNAKKTELLRLGINKREEMMLGNQKINELDNFTCLGSIISYEGGYSEDVKRRIAKAQGADSKVE